MAVKKERAKGSPQKKKVRPRTARAELPEKELRVKLVRSLIGRPWKQREVVKGLGLRKLNSEVIHKDCSEIWGMIQKVPHLVKVEVLEKK